MGLILDTILGRKRSDLLSPTSVLSPWSEQDLGPVVTAEIYGFDIPDLPLTRAAACTLPAVAKGRNLLVSSIAGLPLEALNASLINPDGTVQDGALVNPQPPFLFRTNTSVSPYDRLAATIDDLIFEGTSLWLVERGALQDGAQHAPILTAEWCPWDLWQIKDGRMYVNDVLQGDDDFILFSMPRYAGLLCWGVNTIRGGRDTERAWTKRMQSPIYLVELSEDGDGEGANLQQDEVDKLLADWEEKYKAGKRAIGYSPAGYSIKTHQGALGEADLFLESRNAIRLDIAAFLNIPATMMDASLSEASLTYSTVNGNRSLYYDQLKFWTEPIEQRLSLDDVVPRGQRVRFNKGDMIAPVPNATDTPEED
jgi:hypothetical protein